MLKNNYSSSNSFFTNIDDNKIAIVKLKFNTNKVTEGTVEED